MADSGKIKEMISRFGKNGRLNQTDAVIFMKNIPDRINTIISGMVIADVISDKFGVKNIVYSDSGVREGFIYSEIIKWFGKDGCPIISAGGIPKSLKIWYN